MASQDFSAPFTLYFSTYSICATMVRVTFEFRGKPRPDRPDMNMHFKIIDIGDAGEQLSEHYLCNVSAKGQVPVLVNEKLLPEPMPESCDISDYIADWYPDLLPAEHKETIEKLVAELHEINYAALTFGTETSHFVDLRQKCEEILAKTDLAPRYREALERKKKMYSIVPKFLTQDLIDKNEALSRDFLAEITPLLEESGGSYLFGEKPTMLDAHVLIFLCRIYDASRTNLIPERLLQWVEEFRKGGVWKRTVPGGSTLPPYISAGPAKASV